MHADSVLMVTIIQSRPCPTQNVKRKLVRHLDLFLPCSSGGGPVLVTGMIGNWSMDLITYPQRPVGKEISE